MEISETEIDESLYSRQLYVIGHDAMRRMAASKVLIVGLNGLGAEISKNVILAGVKEVTIFDNSIVEYEDLSSQFYLSEKDIGRAKVDATITKLAELNPYVEVKKLSRSNIFPEDISPFNVVVLVSVSADEKLKITEYCHANNISVIVTDIFGVFGNIFCDFGKAFTVHDSNGEPAPTSMIASITKGNPTLITVLEETRHNLETNDTILLSDLYEWIELNNCEFQVTVKDSYSFEIPIDTSTLPYTYIRGGNITQRKQPMELSFEPYSVSIKNPMNIVGDYMKMDRMLPLHLAFGTLSQFTSLYGRKPLPGSRMDAERFLKLAHDINDREADEAVKISNLDSFNNLLERFSMSCRGIIAPVAAILGGVVGQEVLKACSGKFSPIHQWFYYDALEALSETPLSEDEVTPIGSRYDSQIMLFGKTIMSQLSRLNVFMIGAGAIGCELLKNFALMGIGSADSGLIHVTDMDRIEKSNLSRQFLFRATDINQLKSETAVKAAKVMNPALHAVAYETKMAHESEDFFNDDFFESLDVVFTALDNVEARLYVDQRCLFYHVPLLESGTLGAKGHTQVVVPGQTENYGATRDPPEKSIPVCTLKHFPNQIEHTLQWALEWFSEIYKQTPEDCNKYLEGGSAFEQALASQQNMKLDTLTRVSQALGEERPSTFQDCIQWARSRYEDLFNFRILQLLHSFPLDRLTSTGAPFWSGAKKPPHALQFDFDDALDREFVLSVASLRASVFGIPAPPDLFNGTELTQNWVRVIGQWCREVKLTPFRPLEGVKIPTTEEEAKAESANNAQSSSVASMDVDGECSRMLSALPPPAIPALAVQDFDKDKDAHMKVVSAVGNLRARNYNINEVDLYTARGIAGKITPAIATTTALVAGAVCMELYKILQKKPLESFMNTFCNLAVPLFTGMTPEPPKYTTTTVNGEAFKWSAWDRIDIQDPSITLAGLIAHLDTTYHVQLSMLSSGVTILFSDFMNKKKMQERMNMSVKSIVESIAKKDILPAQKYIILEIVVTDPESDEEVELPYLRLRLQ